MTKTEIYLAFGFVLFYLWQKSQVGTPESFVAAGGNPNWTINVDPFHGGAMVLNPLAGSATSAVQP